MPARCLRVRKTTRIPPLISRGRSDPQPENERKAPMTLHMNDPELVTIDGLGTLERRSSSLPDSSILVEYSRPRPAVRVHRAENLPPIPLFGDVNIAQEGRPR